LCGQASQRQRDVRRLAQGRIAFRGHRDQRDAETLGIGDEVLHLRLLAGPRQRHDDIVGCDHAEIAVACFRGVDEKRRRAGGGEGRRDLAADVTGLAEPGDDQAPFGVANEIGRACKGAAEIGLQCQ